MHRADCTDRREGSPSATVCLELPLAVLCRLLQERSLTACEFRCLDGESHRAGCWAVKSSCTNCP